MEDSDILRQLGWPDELIKAALEGGEALRGSDRINSGIDTTETPTWLESEAQVASQRKR
jgi:hypothetical protein